MATTPLISDHALRHAMPQNKISRGGGGRSGSRLPRPDDTGTMQSAPNANGLFVFSAGVEDSRASRVTFTWFRIRDRFVRVVKVKTVGRGRRIFQN
ncbi:hypothetical protein GWI33_005779 [Rhynchophorus ferrugineus]|uniref:Uncharacterized protein n=1 Tax=Rhynchophorus ferrugineus TaxID=354439 RepID=A0A834IWJ7_RHYFE|nr:hypothetical protein GWI33_005779 [Rhynchophorus ferrugineus]